MPEVKHALRNLSYVRAAVLRNGMRTLGRRQREHRNRSGVNTRIEAGEPPERSVASARMAPPVSIAPLAGCRIALRFQAVRIRRRDLTGRRIQPAGSSDFWWAISGSLPAGLGAVLGGIAESPWRIQPIRMADPQAVSNIQSIGA